MDTQEFAVGQRWVSNSEAELGLGIIKNITGRRVEIRFPAAEEERIYAIDIAPLSRVVYAIGDTVKTQNEQQILITDRQEFKGCYVYQGTDIQGRAIQIHEMDLSSFVHFNQPYDRLFAGQIDKNSQFELRLLARKLLHRLQTSPVWGLLGPRIQPLPHQLYIAHQVAQRHAPRVLLADEVGLGKTIEAGLIIHHQLITGRAERILIVVPDSLIHQWLVEMLRRFNLHFSIIDEERFQYLQDADEANPFDTQQLILCSLTTLTQHDAIFQQALHAHWDLMVVDEAHHLHWSEAVSSPEYDCIEMLARQVKGVLLLTATPEQAGPDSHFAHLRLLDPERYFDRDVFAQQAEHYRAVSALVTRLLAEDAHAQLEVLIPDLGHYLDDELCQSLSSDTDFERQRDQVIQALLDRHGTGRVFFRNTRASVTGFPGRVLQAYPLEKPVRYVEQEQGGDIRALLQPEHCLEHDWLQRDPRVSWLETWLSQHKSEKVLLICACTETAVQLEQRLRLKTPVRSALFHEGMTLVQRDRAAAYFAEQEGGAQILICSEIGSEGRNFQFAHHLILFDLPLNPDLLEQRIGRLDRIGQTQTVHIHVPYYAQSAQSVLLDWYHQGMDAFEQVCVIGHTLYQTLETALRYCLTHPDDKQAQQELLAVTREQKQRLVEQYQQGRDILLELNSCNKQVAHQLIEELSQYDAADELAAFMDSVFDEYGVDVQRHSADLLIIKPGEHMLQSQFPALPEEGVTVSYYRHRALAREDVLFLSWEHPMVQGCLDMILHGDFGNSAFCTLESAQYPAGTLLLEAIFTLHCPAPKSLQLQRYLPQSCTRIVIDAAGNEYQDELTEAYFHQYAGRIPKATAQEMVRHARENITTLIQQAQSAARQRESAFIDQAISQMQVTMQAEYDRLQALSKKNPLIRQEEIDYIEHTQTALHDALRQAQMRLDAVRVVIVTQ